MRTLTILISIVLIFSLSSCKRKRYRRSQPVQVFKFWAKPRVSLRTAQNIHAKCKYDVGMNKVPQVEKKILIDDCMKMKGFRISNYRR
jgi:hypothetical protein